MSRYSDAQSIELKTAQGMPETVMELPYSSGCDALIDIFNQVFADAEHTLLIKGGDEPIYLPKSRSEPYHRIIFTRDYFSSALHEVAHWCVAGVERRQLEDYGYWYAPDGRSAEQQREFELVEVKPQAVEWIFHTACARPFRVSADNVEAGLGASDSFKVAIYRQVLRYLEHGLPDRAADFATALSDYFGTQDPLSSTCYAISDL